MQITDVPQLKSQTPMELTLRIGDLDNQTDKHFRADMALLAHYALAPYHKPNPHTKLPAPGPPMK
jgi:hypothetical protein